ncbi:MAG: prepilin-type N-terminal cleavage/methylation domain-containing protein [Lachnospiraceae bacterium]|nr:prepilin-type N-terminal cleavage/methylation domain-containing protein [Lachnospiraceae bacterium]
MKQLKDDNSGLSLIEVLVAMIILAIVVTPFLHSFVTTASANTKAKKMHRATTLAQSVMEGLKAERLENISAQFNYPGVNFRIMPTSQVGTIGEYRLNATGGYDAVKKNEEYSPDPSVTDRKKGFAGLADHASTYSTDGGTTYELVANSDSKYYFQMKNVDIDGSKYDVRIKLDGTTADAQNYNTKDLVQMPIIDEEQDALCIQQMAYTMSAISECSITDVPAQLIRKITITVSENSGRTTVTVHYHYEKYGDSSLDFDRESVCYDSAQYTKDLRAIYLYFTPLYSTRSDFDVIEYVNPQNIPVSLNVFKQKLDTLTTEQSAVNMKRTEASTEDTCKLQIDFTCTGVQKADLKTKVYTNIYQNLANPGYSVTGVLYDIKYNGSAASDLFAGDVMYAGHEANRVYDAEVTVYEAGTEKLLTTMKGSILD